MQTDDITIRVQPAGRPWQKLDTDPDSPVLTANTWGPDRASFGVRRDPAIPWADLAAHRPVEIDIAGVTVWDGRIRETPGNDDTDTISVECEGWQYQLDDLPIRRLYVHTRLPDWKDWRTNLIADLTAYRTGWAVEAGTGGLAITNSVGGGSFPRGGAYLDLGFSDAAKRVVITYTNNAWAGTATAYFYASDTLADLNTASGATAINDLTAAVTNGTAAFTTSARYLLILADTNTSQADDRFFKATSVQVFGSTAWESGGISTLTADDVIKDALTEGATLLADDLTGITAETLAIPALAALDPRTPRELVQAVNALHNHLLRVDVGRRVIFRERPTAPAFHVGAWSGAPYNDAGLNSGQDLFDTALVTGSAADGSRHFTERTQTLALLNAPRGQEIQIGSPLTTPIGEAIGDKFLAAHAKSRLYGEVALSGPYAVRGHAGEPVHPSLLLRHAQELLRLDDRVDPDTGGIGRNGSIASVEYRHAERTAVVGVDDTNRDFETLLARYDLLAGAAIGA